MLFERSMATLTGVIARKSAASKPASGPKRLRIRQYRSQTEPMPSSTCGSKMLAGRKPKSLTLATWIHSATGGLSTERKPAGSKEL